MSSLYQKCVRCGWLPMDNPLNEEDKLYIWCLKQQGMNLFAITKIREILNIDLKDAKAFHHHINRRYGHCIRCRNTSLTHENIVCPKCKAFNYNWNIEPAFNAEFCNELEYRMDFKSLDNDRLKGYWCDGVSHFPDDFLSLMVSRVLENKEILTTARTGNSGQEVFDLKIKLGPKALDAYANKGNLIECLPDKRKNGWLTVAPESRYLEVQLA